MVQSYGLGLINLDKHWDAVLVRILLATAIVTEVFNSSFPQTHQPVVWMMARILAVAASIPIPSPTTKVRT